MTDMQGRNTNQNQLFDSTISDIGGNWRCIWDVDVLNLKTWLTMIYVEGPKRNVCDWSNWMDRHHSYCIMFLSKQNASTHRSQHHEWYQYEQHDSPSCRFEITTTMTKGSRLDHNLSVLDGTIQSHLWSILRWPHIPMRRRNQTTTSSPLRGRGPPSLKVLFG